MNTKFTPTVQTGNGYTYLELKGILDEDNLLANLLSQIQGRLLLIDLAEIERINSCGVRDWVNWIIQIQALGIKIILLRCSPAIIAQANMVANFSADAFIHSFYAPYIHPTTGDDVNKLILTEDIRTQHPIHAPKFYTESGEELEFDAFEESYFAFINDPKIMNYQIPDDIQRIIEGYMPEIAQIRQSANKSDAPKPTTPMVDPIPRPTQPTRHAQPPLPAADYKPAPTAEVNGLPKANLPAPHSQSAIQPCLDLPASKPIIPVEQQNIAQPAPSKNPAQPAKSPDTPLASPLTTVPLNEKEKKQTIIFIAGTIIVVLLLVFIVVIIMKVSG